MVPGKFFPSRFGFPNLQTADERAKMLYYKTYIKYDRNLELRVVDELRSILITVMSCYLVVACSSYAKMKTKTKTKVWFVLMHDERSNPSMYITILKAWFVCHRVYPEHMKSFVFGFVLGFSWHMNSL